MIKSEINLLAILVLLASCAGNVHYDADKPHHTQDGFRNLYYKDDQRYGFWDYMTWRWQRQAQDRPDAEDYDFKIIKERHAFRGNDTPNPSLTWIGHATFLIRFADMTIVTDPQFSHRASPLTWAGPQRVVPPAYSIEELPDIDVVIISHDHYDSLDVASVRQLAVHNRNRSLTFLVPLGLKTWFDSLDLKSVRVVELDWGQSHSIKGVDFTAEPCQHWSKRTLFDAFERLWASWVIEHGNHRIFFAGDTGYARHFKDIGNKYGRFDLALLPIGAYEPRWFMKPYHVNPEEAVKIHLDIKSDYSVAMHWGTFILSDEPLDEPPVKLAAALKKYQIPENQFEVFKHGQTRFLDQVLGGKGGRF